MEQASRECFFFLKDDEEAKAKKLDISSPDVVDNEDDDETPSASQKSVSQAPTSDKTDSKKASKQADLEVRCPYFFWCGEGSLLNGNSWSMIMPKRPFDRHYCFQEEESDVEMAAEASASEDVEGQEGNPDEEDEEDEVEEEKPSTKPTTSPHRRRAARKAE